MSTSRVQVEFRVENRVGDAVGASDQTPGPRRLVRQSELARELAVTSQRISTWRTRSSRNGFPSAVACNVGPTTGGGKRRHLLWDLDEVLTWFRAYDEAAQRSRRGPLFGPNRVEESA